MEDFDQLFKYFFMNEISKLNSLTFNIRSSKLNHLSFLWTTYWMKPNESRLHCKQQRHCNGDVQDTALQIMHLDHRINYQNIRPYFQNSQTRVSLVKFISISSVFWYNGNISEIIHCKLTSIYKILEHQRTKNFTLISE